MKLCRLDQHDDGYYGVGGGAGEPRRDLYRRTNPVVCFGDTLLIRGKARGDGVEEGVQTGRGGGC